MLMHIRSVIQEKILGVFKKHPGSGGEILLGGVGKPQLPVYVGADPADLEIPVLAAQDEAGQDGDAEPLVHHGQDGEFIDRDIADVRVDMVFPERAVQVAGGGVLCGDKGDPVELRDGDLVERGEGMSFWDHSVQLIVHHGEELVILSFLPADKSDVHAPLPDPVR